VVLRIVATYLRSNVLAGVALFVALGGTGYAMSGGFVAKSGQLSGCVGPSRVLKLLKPGHRCAKGQTAVAWNITGPRGPAGATGAAGAAGASGQSVVGGIGPVGPSDAYTATIHGSPISLAPGAYELFAKASWFNGQKATVEPFRCELGTPTEIFDEQEVDVEAESEATLTLGGPVALSSATTVSLVCTPPEGTVNLEELTAVRVGSLHEQ
jgi:hypothetical protein